MPANFADLPPRYLRTPEAARFVGLSIRTLEKHRIYGTGPRYSKLGGRVVYRVEDLQAWVESGAKASTSDPGTATVLPAKRHSARRSGRPPAGAPLTHVAPSPPPLRTRAARTLPGSARRSRAARCAGSHGLSVLQPRQDAPHDADRLQDERHRHSRRSGGRARHGDHLGCRRADLGRQPDRRGPRRRTAHVAPHGGDGRARS